MSLRIFALTLSSVVLLASQPVLAGRVHDARVHRDSGRRFFDAGSYALAIDEFHQALRFGGPAILWFHIGRAHQLSGECDSALAAYEEYLRAEPAAAKRTDVAARIEEVRDCVAKEREQAASRERDTAAVALSPASWREPGSLDSREAPSPEPTSVTVTGRRAVVYDGSTHRWIGGSVFVAGLFAGGASIYLLVGARNQADDLSQRYQQGGTWDAEAEAAERRIDSDTSKSVILAGVGGAALVVGAYLYLSGREQREYAERFALTPRRGGATVVGSWRF